jgi:hypothetical protein
LARVLVYKSVRYDPNTDQQLVHPKMGTRDAIRLATYSVIEDSVTEVNESELDANWFYCPKSKA